MDSMDWCGQKILYVCSTPRNKWSALRRKTVSIDEANDIEQDVSPKLSNEREPLQARWDRKAKERSVLHFEKQGVDMQERVNRVIRKLQWTLARTFVLFDPPSVLQLMAKSVHTLYPYLQQLEKFCDDARAGRTERPFSVANLDTVVTKFYEEEFAKGRSQAKPAQLQAGLQLLVSSLKGQLQKSSQAAKAFSELSPPESSEPFPTFLLGHFIKQECEAGRVQHAELALAYFETFARKEELGRLRIEHYQTADKKSGYKVAANIELPHDPSKGCYQKTKRTQHIGVGIRLARVLNFRKQDAIDKGRSKLFDVRPAQLQYRIDQFKQRLGIGHLKIGIHSLRHAAAVDRHLLGESDDVIRQMGRWSTLVNMNIYLSRTGNMLHTMSERFTKGFRDQGYDLFQRRYSYIEAHW